MAVILLSFALLYIFFFASYVDVRVVTVNVTTLGRSLYY